MCVVLAVLNIIKVFNPPIRRGKQLRDSKCVLCKYIYPFFPSLA